MTEKTIKPSQPESTNREAFERDARIHKTPITKAEKDARIVARVGNSSDARRHRGTCRPASGGCGK